MAVKVIDKATQRELEVSPEEAATGIASGALVVAQPTVRVLRGDGEIGTVSTDKLGEAQAHGWSLADEDMVDAAKLRREETDLGSSIQGGLEAAAAGATLGGSTAIEAALGMDVDRMRARREGLGGIGTGLEIAGALAPTLLTGGGSAAAQAGARGLGARALGAMPTGLAARAGAGFERVLGAALPSTGIARTVVPMAGRGLVEGFAAGAGAEIDESILGERDLTAERVLAAGGMGALFGGAAGGAVPGLAAVGQGIGKVGARPLREILGRASGAVDDLGDAGLASILRSPTVRKHVASFNNLDPSDLNRTWDDMLDNPVDFHRAAVDPARYTEEIAASVRPEVEGWRAARKIAVTEGSGAARMRDVSRHLPTSTDDLARIAEQSAKKLDAIEARLLSEDAAIAGGTSSANRPFINNAVMLTRRARERISAVANAPGSTPKRIATVAHGEIDDLSQGLRELRQGAGSVARSFESKGTLDVIAPLHDDVREFLSDARLFGDAGTRHAERNVLMARAIKAQKDAGNSASGRLLDRDSIVDNADLLSTVRNSGRFAGATKTELFEDAIKAENDYLDWMVRNGDIDDATKATIREQLGAGKRISEAFEKQRQKVRSLDTLNMWKTMETNASVSSGIFSNFGPAVLGAVGLGLGGPIGAAAGALAGMAFKPHALTRKMAAILARSKTGEAGTMKAIGGIMKRVGEGTAAAARGGGRVVSRAAPQVGRKGGDAVDRKAVAASTRDRAQLLATNPGLLAAEMQTLTQDMEDEAPRLAKAIAMKASQAVGYLAQHAPASYTPPMSRKAKPLMDPIELELYSRRIEAVTRPFDALARIDTGTLTSEHVDALKNVWPEIYADVRRQLFDAVAVSPDDLTLSAATSLSVLWGIPIDPTLPLAAGMILSLTPPAGAQQGGPQPQGKGGKAPELDAGLYDTNTQKIGQIT